MALYDLWIEGLVTRTELDGTRLARGATATRKGHVGAIELEPGIVRAVVHSASEATTVLGVAVVSDQRWREIMEIVTARSSLSAALLAGEVPEELVGWLLPQKGEISCDCSCSDGGEPCVHAASLLHAVGELFDMEPFAFVLIRGRGRNDLVTELRARRASSLGLEPPDSADLPRGADSGTPATDAWRRDPQPLSTSPRLPRQPGSLVTLAAPPPSDAGIDGDELRTLVEDAAARAHAVLTGDGETGLGLSVGLDVVRRAATGDIEAISASTKVSFDELACAAQAWHFGRAAGLRVSREKWDPEPSKLQPGLEALGPDSRARTNRVSLLGRQLRLDEDGLWWLFTADDNLGWVLASEGVADPFELV